MSINKKIDAHEEDIRLVYKIVNKLEQRISKLEKSLASHAKCIGEIREEKSCPTKKQ
tara:strand:- start:6 stop:176 length:171 start_codon:yes stop_codon:yes gene_type:complete